MKKTNENLVILITLFAISIVIANVTGARTITTGLHIGPIELALSGGAITYAVTFLCTDIIGEIWGKATAQRVVKYGFIGQIFATACIMITGVFPATDAVMDNAYQTLLGQNWIFVIGSLSAYLVSQSWDVAVFHAIRDRYIAKHGSTKGGRWLWNNGSTITSQIWDTVIYAVISFGFGLGWVHTHEGRMQLIGIIIGQYLLKACLALLDKYDVLAGFVDLSGYVEKEAGKGLSDENFTAALKDKLDGIAAGANKYVHPTHTAAASGLYKTTVDEEGHVTATTPVTKDDITKLGIPAQDTTYGKASAAADGLMAAADKSKLDGMIIATDSEVSEMLAEVYGE